MKHIHNLRPLALAFILVVTGIAAAVCGLVMKGQIGRASCRERVSLHV